MTGIHWAGHFLLALEEKVALEKSPRKDFHTCGWESETSKSRVTEAGKQGAS